MTDRRTAWSPPGGGSPSSPSGTVLDANIPAAIARDVEVVDAVAAEADLRQIADDAALAALAAILDGADFTGPVTAPTLGGRRYAALFPGASVTAKLNAAIADLAGATGIVDTTGLGAGEPTAVPENVTIFDTRGGLPGNGWRFNTSSVPAGGGQLAGVHYQRSFASPAVSATTLYVQVRVSGTLPTFNTQEALSGATSVDGALGSSFPAGGVVAGGEGVAAVQSTGGGILDVCGWTAGPQTTAGSTTPVGNMRSFWAKAPVKNGAGDVLNAYSLVCEAPAAGTVRNYAAWFQGNTLYNNGSIRKVLDKTGASATDAATTNGSAVLTCTNAAFTAAMVGRPIFIPGAAAGGGTLPAKISAFTNAGQVTLDRNATATTSGQIVPIPGGEIQVEALGRPGTDDLILYNMLDPAVGFRWGAPGGFDYMDLTSALFSVKVNTRYQNAVAITVPDSAANVRSVISYGLGGGVDNVQYRPLTDAAGWHWQSVAGVDVASLTPTAAAVAGLNTQFLVNVAAFIQANATIGAVGSALSFFGGTRRVKQTIAADATDLATALALVNSIAAALRAPAGYGLVN